MPKNYVMPWEYHKAVIDLTDLLRKDESRLTPGEIALCKVIQAHIETKTVRLESRADWLERNKRT